MFSLVNNGLWRFLIIPPSRTRNRPTLCMLCSLSLNALYGRGVIPPHKKDHASFRRDHRGLRMTFGLLLLFLLLFEKASKPVWRVRHHLKRFECMPCQRNLEASVLECALDSFSACSPSGPCPTIHPSVGDGERNCERGPRRNPSLEKRGQLAMKGHLLLFLLPHMLKEQKTLFCCVRFLLYFFSRLTEKSSVVSPSLPRAFNLSQKSSLSFLLSCHARPISVTGKRGKTSFLCVAPRRKWREKTCFLALVVNAFSLFLAFLACFFFVSNEHDDRMLLCRARPWLLERAPIAVTWTLPLQAECNATLLRFAYENWKVEKVQCILDFPTRKVWVDLFLKSRLNWLDVNSSDFSVILLSFCLCLWA